MPLVSFNTPRNHQKSSGFVILSGGVKRDQWHENGLIKLKFHKMVILLIILRKSCEWLKNNCCKIILHKISRVINLDHMVYDQISYLPPSPPSPSIHTYPFGFEALQIVNSLAMLFIEIMFACLKERTR